MQTKKFILIAAFALVAAPTLAQTAQPALPTESATVTDTALSCVHQDSPTGSRLGAKKVCHTQAQWREIRAESALDLQNLQTRTDNSYQKNGN